MVGPSTDRGFGRAREQQQHSLMEVDPMHIALVHGRSQNRASIEIKATKSEDHGFHSQSADVVL